MEFLADIFVPVIIVLVVAGLTYLAFQGIDTIVYAISGTESPKQRDTRIKMREIEEHGNYTRKEDKHWIHADEPLTCPLSGTEFYRWEWSDFKDTQDWEYSHPEWPLTEHMSNEDGTMMRLVCVPCFEDRQDEIQARNNEVHEREQAEWAALSLEEKQERHDEGIQDTGPVVRLSDEGLYEKYDSEKGTWVRIPGSLNELTGRSD